MHLPLTEMGSVVNSADLGKETRTSVLYISLRCPHIQSCHTDTKTHRVQFILLTESFY